MQVARHITCDCSGRFLCTRFATVDDLEVGTYTVPVITHMRWKLQGPAAVETLLGACAFSSFRQRDTGRKDTQETAHSSLRT
jgi:hypothetical protein